MTEKKEERVRDRVRYICCAAGVVLTCLVTGCGKTEENLDIAMQKIQELDYQGALEDLAKAQEAGENVRLVNRARGIAHMGLTEYEEAITDFQAALAGSVIVICQAGKGDQIGRMNVVFIVGDRTYGQVKVSGEFFLADAFFSAQRGKDISRVHSFRLP